MFAQILPQIAAIMSAHWAWRMSAAIAQDSVHSDTKCTIAFALSQLLALLTVPGRTSNCRKANKPERTCSPELHINDHGVLRPLDASSSRGSSGCRQQWGSRWNIHLKKIKKKVTHKFQVIAACWHRIFKTEKNNCFFLFACSHTC